MDSAYLASAAEALEYFSVSEANGLSFSQVKDLAAKHGRNGTVLKSHCNLTLWLKPSSTRRRPPNASVGAGPRTI